MRHNYKEFVLISADLDYLNSVGNRRRRELMRACLNDLHVKYTECEGYYKDNSEKSFYVELNHSKGFTEEFYKNLACNTFQQECILYRDKYNKCYLLGETDKEIGTMVSLTEDEFYKAENATEINGKYWGVK